MALLLASNGGFKTRALDPGVAPNQPDGGTDGAAGVTNDTSGWKFDTGAGAAGSSSLWDTTNHWAFASGRHYFPSMYFTFSNLSPAAGRGIVRLTAAATAVLAVRVNANNTIALWNMTGTPAQIGSDSVAALSVGVRALIELDWMINTASTSDFAALYLDGVLVASATVSLGNAAADQLAFGWMAGISSGGVLDANFVMNVDDFVMTDDQGASMNTRLGAHKVYLHNPLSDNARVGWTGGAGGTTNLFNGVKSRPPAGVANSVATNSSQVKDNVNNTTDTYDVNMESYDEAGVPSTDTIVAVIPIGNVARTTNNHDIGLSCLSNPAVAEELQTCTTICGTWPSNWYWKRLAYVSNPTVVRATRPVLRLRRATADTNFVHCDCLGIYTVSTPAAPAAGTFAQPLYAIAAHSPAQHLLGSRNFAGSGLPPPNFSGSDPERLLRGIGQ